MFCNVYKLKHQIQINVVKEMQINKHAILDIIEWQT